MDRFLRYLWAAPTTVVGLALAVASMRRGHVAIVDGVIEAHSPFLRRALASLTPLAHGADAMTLGHVVIGRDARALELTRAHERVHVRQYEWWGPLFVPVYLLAGLWALIKGGHPYFDNRFELEAHLAEIAAARSSTGPTSDQRPTTSAQATRNVSPPSPAGNGQPSPRKTF